MEDWHHEANTANNNEQRYQTRFSDPPIPSLPLATVLKQLYLGEGQERPTIEEALTDLQSQDWHRRAMAVRSLENLGEGVPLDLLLSTLKDADGTVRATAIHALAKVGAQVPLHYFLVALQDQDWHVRETALLVLAQSKRPVSREIFLSALNDNNSLVCEAAQVALALFDSHSDTAKNVQEKARKGARRQKNMHESQTTNEAVNHYPFSSYNEENEAQIRQPEQTEYSHSRWEKVTSYPPRRRVRRRVVMFGLLGLVAAGGGAAYEIAQFVGASHSKGETGIHKQPVQSPAPVVTPKQEAHGTPIQRATPSAVNLQPLTYQGHANAVISIAWSPDGRRIASASADKTVQVWEVATGRTLLTYRGHNDAVYSVSWSPDGKQLASASRGNDVQVWNAQTGERTLQYFDASKSVWVVAWSPNSTLIASGGGRYDGSDLPNIAVQVWDETSGTTFLAHKDAPSSTTSSILRAIGWSPDGKRIASASTHVEIWNSATEEVLLTFTGGHGEPYSVNALAWSPDGKQIASCVSNSGDSADRTVQIWDSVSGRIFQTYRGHFAQARTASSSLAQLSSLLSPFQQASQKSALAGGGLGVTSVAWSPDGKLVASGADGSDMTVQVWHPETGQQVFVYRGHTAGVQSVAWSPSGTWIASAGDDKTVQIWQTS